MSNYLSIDEAVDLSGMDKETFVNRYIEGGIISINVENGIRSIELSEFLRVFPNAKSKTVLTANDARVEVLLSQQKIENLEYQVVQLQRQLEKQTEDYNWLRNKFDNTTLLLEQKLDTSELDQHKQEIKKLSEQSIQWEKKYNTLLAANELKTLIKENRDLKEKLDSISSRQKNMAANQGSTNILPQQQPSFSGAATSQAQTQSVAGVQASSSQVAANPQHQGNSRHDGHFRHSPEPEPAIIKKRRKIFGIF